jgi:AraC-like DNA-binding protein
MNQEVVTYEPEDDERLAYRVATITDAMRVAKLREAEEKNRQTVPPPEEDPDPYGYLQEIGNQLSYEVLAPHWKANPDDPMWVKRVKARAKKEEITKLLIQGHKVPEIARRCNLSESTVVKYIMDVQAEWRRSYMDDAELMAARDMDRLDYYLSQLAEKIEEGDIKAINSAIEIVRVRANILGYAQGVQVDISQYIAEVAEANGFDPERAIALASRVSISMK